MAFWLPFWGLLVAFLEASLEDLQPGSFVLVAFWWPFCGLLVALLGPFGGLLVAFWLPFCGLLVAFLEAGWPEYLVLVLTAGHIQPAGQNI